VTEIKITVQNLAAVERALAQYGAKAEAEIAKAVTAAALTITNDIKRAIQGPPKTGRIYKRGKLGRNHQASAPGEAPATDTGALVNSIAYKQETKLSAIVSSRLNYAPWLEYGTRRIAPRPSWRPAVDKNTPLFQKLVDAAIRRAAQ
jgi:hypothetical protein